MTNLHALQARNSVVPYMTEPATIKEVRVESPSIVDDYVRLSMLNSVINHSHNISAPEVSDRHLETTSDTNTQSDTSYSSSGADCDNSSNSGSSYDSGSTSDSGSSWDSGSDSSSSFDSGSSDSSFSSSGVDS